MLLNLFLFFLSNPFPLRFLKAWGPRVALPAWQDLLCAGTAGFCWAGRWRCALLGLPLLMGSEGLLGESVLPAGCSACRSSQHGLLHRL